MDDGGTQRWSSTNKRRLAVVAGMAVIVTGAVVLAQDGEPDVHVPPVAEATTAPPTLVRSDVAPPALPEGIVPAEALEVEGVVIQDPDEPFASVSFRTTGTRDEVQAHVANVLAGTTWQLRQNVYDDETFESIWDLPDGSVLTVSHVTMADGTGTAVIVRGPAARTN